MIVLNFPTHPDLIPNLTYPVPPFDILINGYRRSFGDWLAIFNISESQVQDYLALGYSLEKALSATCHKTRISPSHPSSLLFHPHHLSNPQPMRPKLLRRTSEIMAFKVRLLYPQYKGVDVASFCYRLLTAYNPPKPLPPSPTLFWPWYPTISLTSHENERYQIFINHVYPLFFCVESFLPLPLFTYYFSGQCYTKSFTIPFKALKPYLNYSANDLMRVTGIHKFIITRAFKRIGFHFHKWLPTPGYVLIETARKYDTYVKKRQESQKMRMHLKKFSHKPSA